MSRHLPLRTIPKLIALLAAFGLFALAAEASEPVEIESSAWTTTGTMKAKVDSLRQELAVVVTLEFGPRLDLPEGQFRLTVDDGESPFEIVGLYEEMAPGKPTFPDLADQFAEGLGLVPELEDMALKSRINAKPKLKDGVEVIEVAFNFTVKLSIDGEPMTVSARYKGEGTHVE